MKKNIDKSKIREKMIGDLKKLHISLKLQEIKELKQRLDNLEKDLESIGA
jgi:hypothetical protein